MNPSPSNGKRLVYFYFNRDKPERIRHAVPAHVDLLAQGRPGRVYGRPVCRSIRRADLIHSRKPGGGE
jgi:hypothetical protein